MNSSSSSPKVLTYGYQVKQGMISKRYQRSINTQPKQPQLGIIIKPARGTKQKVSEAFELTFDDDLCNQQRRKEVISFDLDPNDEEMTQCAGSP